MRRLILQKIDDNDVASATAYDVVATSAAYHDVVTVNRCCS